ncbi:fumarylacetoacetate hydrolase family protein [Bisporella sp. PMI_857]|nr:fumarylacetoacetate hydrolase family protein [Bisporella sp. PMI_857]
MPRFSRLIRFESALDGQPYFADLGAQTSEVPALGTQITGFKSFEDVGIESLGKQVAIAKLLAPVPYPNVPLYCVGLNYRSHAAEASLKIPAAPPLWTKPHTSLADPDEDIEMNKFCASTFPDYEGELVFVTSKTCKDVSVSDAHLYILGYTCGNDLSCRLHQLPDQAGGQFFFAKAFDKFAPLGPVLVSPEAFGDVYDNKKIIVRVNGKVRQEAEFKGDLIFSPAQILSRMSQGTTIPAGTAIMTGTCAGVGAFMKPKTFLANGDVVEVEISNIGVLRNKIMFT